MTVYLGDQGGVELRRFIDGDEPLSGVLTDEEVNLSNNTFEHPFHTPNGPAFTTELSPFVSGDRVRVTRNDKNPDGTYKSLVLVKDLPPTRTQEFYVAVGVDGRLSCYRLFDDAVMKRNRYQLLAAAEEQNVTMEPVAGIARCLANVTSYEFTADRDTVDTTSLGQEFREKYTRGLISGQGSLECFWNYQASICGNESDSDYSAEFANYLIELSQRVTYGADFLGTFYLKRDSRRSVWQEAQCVVTNASFSVAAGEIITSTIKFVTTGPLKLAVGRPRFELLLEDGDVMLQEDLSDTLQETDE